MLLVVGPDTLFEKLIAKLLFDDDVPADITILQDEFDVLFE